jgi:hypothetical protein
VQLPQSLSDFATVEMTIGEELNATKTFPVPADQPNLQMVIYHLNLVP